MNRKHYRITRIPKKTGGVRFIEEPVDWLKKEQSMILRKLYTLPVSTNAHGFIRKKSPVTNAEVHRKNRTIIRVDLKDFFPSIDAKKIINALTRYWPRDEAERVARLCTIDGRLPQGAPTSPALANIVACQLDARLAGFANSLDAVYTRYADDIIFSFPKKRSKKFCLKVLLFIQKIIKDCGFRVNRKKTRIRYGPGQQRKITGIVVNDKQQLSVPRAYRRKLRARIHQLDPTDQTELRRIRGVIAWMHAVNKHQAKLYEKMLQAKIAHQ